MRPAVLLTGAGKRYDIVSCFARLTRTVAADPSPLAPAQYAAHVRALDPPRARPRAGTLLRLLRRGAGDGPARDGRAGAVDRLPRRSRRALPQRDPADDARVARRRVDQGRGRA